MSPSAVPSPDKKGESGNRLPRPASEDLLPMVFTPGSTRLGWAGSPVLISCGEGINIAEVKKDYVDILLGNIDHLLKQALRMV